MRLIDADATTNYLLEFRCKDCDRRKGMKNGKIRFCYEIGEAPCRACDIGDTIDYFLDEDISPTIDAVPVVRCKDCKHNDPFGCHKFGVIVGDNFYCAYGEKTGGDKDGCESRTTAETAAGTDPGMAAQG